MGGISIGPFTPSQECLLAVSPIKATADQREARRALASFPDFPNRRLALLPFALFVERSAPVPFGVLNLQTGAAISVSK
jgi:hypothetical protein